MFKQQLSIKLLILFIIHINLFANDNIMPTRFIGAYTETNGDVYKNLVQPNISKEMGIDNWNLSSLTEKLLSNEFKSKLHGKNFNLALTKEFESEKFKQELDENDNPNKKIGFFHVDTYKSEDTLLTGEKYILITLSLIYAEIGEEANRVASNNFEVRYTNGITVSGSVYLKKNDPNRDTILHKAYKKYYKKALGKLLDTIIHDQHSKELSIMGTNDEIYFSLGSINIGKKAKKLAKEVYESEELIKTQLLMLLQESLIKNIRQEKKLESIVLLYPDKLNTIIVKDWKRYLRRMNAIFSEGSSNENAEIRVRKIMPSCQNSNMATSREIPLGGYLIEAYLSELYNKTTLKDDVDSVNVIQSSIVSRIVIPLRRKQKIDGMSIPLNALKKKKMITAQAHEGYVLENDLSRVRKDKVAKLLRATVDRLSPKLVDRIKDIVELRHSKDILDFNYKDFCQED